MNIVILDAYTTNPGDLTWDGLAALGALTVHERTPRDLVITRAQEADAIIVNKVRLSAEVLAALPRLRYIGLLSTGVNVVDLDAAQAQNIPVCNVPAYSSMSVAQLVFAYILSFANEVEMHSAHVRAGNWAKSRDFCYWKKNLVELDGLTLGLIGYGQIAQAVARIARAFGMRVIVHTRTPQSDPTVEFLPIESVFQEADYLSLHCPLTPQTDKLINAERLAWMKPSAILINTGRGGLVDDYALATALDTHRIAGAGLDVLTNEPPHEDQPLLKAQNCRITPHIAWATRAARSRLVEIATANLAAFLDGHPQNNVVPLNG